MKATMAFNFLKSILQWELVKKLTNNTVPLSVQLTTLSAIE